MLKREFNNLLNLFNRRKILIIFGARRTGKTTLLNNFLKTSNLKYKLDTGDSLRLQMLFSDCDIKKILEYVSDYELIALDEAQEIPDIGQALKIISDYSNVKVIATGSSSFRLSQKTGEPLTGRKVTVTLYPISQKELRSHYNKYELREKLNEFLIFGSYPEVVTAKTKQEKIDILKELVDSYLLKDILTHEKIKSPKVLLQIVKLLAFQIGNEVSLNEIATQVQVDVKTVSRYFDLLEKCFVIKTISAYSTNLRKEITTKNKYIFYDNGVRNAIISQFAELDDRNDIGQLFENFVITERIKKLSYEKFYGNIYFWRNYNGQEIDLVEEIDGKLSAVEIKLNKIVKPPSNWMKNYPKADFKVITTDNYLDFVL